MLFRSMLVDRALARIAFQQLQRSRLRLSASCSHLAHLLSSECSSLQRCSERNPKVCIARVQTLGRSEARFVDVGDVVVIGRLIRAKLS